MEIFKVQWPISTNYETPCCLIYNKDRSIEFEAPENLVTGIRKGNELKAFFKAEIVGEQFRVIDRAEWQDW